MFDALAPSLTPVRTPVGDAWILAEDEPMLMAAQARPSGARLLPSGDAYMLLQGADRDLLVPDADRRGTLWTPRVWPGSILVEGELVGTWQRSEANVTLRLSSAERAAIESEAESLLLPGAANRIVIAWQVGID